VKTALS